MAAACKLMRLSCVDSTSQKSTLQVYAKCMMILLADSSHHGQRSQASAEVELSRVCCFCRFVDPNDPSRIYLTTPVEDSERLPTAPVYAANFSQTQNESYQDMGLRP